MNTIKLLGALAVWAIVSHVYAQGSPEALEQRNGFKDVKLLSAVSSYEGLEYKKDDTHKLYKEITLHQPKKGHYEAIGNIQIIKMVVKAYKGDIFQIQVITEKDPKLYRGLKKNFGEPKFDLRGNKYYWTASSLSLSFKSIDKNKLELVYNSLEMPKRLDQEKVEEIDDIADDF